MYGQSHVGLGWVIGAAVRGSDRALRVWCTAAAILPDVDALVILAGKQYYDRFHHTFGHNVFTGMLCTAAAALWFRRRPWRAWAKAVFFVAACFASHLLTDMKLSGWELYLFWPFGSRGYEFQPNLQLGDPVNTVLVAVLMTLPWLMAFWKQVTPLEIVSTRLDRIVLNFFRRRDLACGGCGKPCNNRCDACGAPVCMKHGAIDRRFRIACRACRARPPGGAPCPGTPRAVGAESNPFGGPLRSLSS